MNTGPTHRRKMVAAAVVLLPLVPLLLLGDSLDTRVEGWLNPPPPPAMLAAGTAALLACDVFLPVPSSLLSTFCGQQLGVVAATLTSWLGMTVGAGLGFGLSRWLGQAWTRRWGGAQEVEQAQTLSHEVGPFALAITRPVPLLAEATVLYLGASGLSWQRFWLPVVLSNLGISVVYSWLGQWAGQRGYLGLALAASVVLPAAGSWWVRKRLRRSSAAGNGTLP